jgi:hypothetical protein
MSSKLSQHQKDLKQAKSEALKFHARMLKAKRLALKKKQAKPLELGL